MGIESNNADYSSTGLHEVSQLRWIKIVEKWRGEIERRREDIQVDTDALSALLEELADGAHTSLTTEFLLVASDAAHGLVLWERRVELERAVFEFEGDIGVGGPCASDGGGNLLVGNVAPRAVEVGVDDELDRF